MKGVGDKEDDWAAVLRAALGLPASAEEPGKAAARETVVPEVEKFDAVADGKQTARFIRVVALTYDGLVIAICLSAILGGWPLRRGGTRTAASAAARAEATTDAPVITVTPTPIQAPASVVAAAPALPTAQLQATAAPQATATSKPIMTLVPADTATATPTTTPAWTATDRPTRQPTKTKVPIVPVVPATSAPAASKVPAPTALPAATPVPTEDIGALSTDELMLRGDAACGGSDWLKSGGCKNVAAARRWYELAGNGGESWAWTTIGHT